MKRLGYALVGTVLAGSAAFLAAAPASALPATETWCEGSDLHIRTGNGGSGVIYDSVKCT